MPVAPCRVATAAKGGPLKPKKSRTYRVAGAASYASQGGNPHGCGIPASATAVAINLTTTATTKNGYLRAWASGTPAPAARVLSYVKKQPATGSGTIGLGASDGRLVVGNAGGQAKVEVDVTGYYLPQMHAMISPASSGDSTHNAPIYAGSSRVVSATNPQDGVYVVTFDSPVTYCTPVVDTYNAGEGIYGAAYAFSGNTATVFTWYLDGGHEKPFSFYFYIDMVC